MSTAKEMAVLIGATGTYWVLDMQVAVKVTDARMRFGALDVQVSPVAGSGSAWVRLDSIQDIAFGATAS